MIHFIRKEHPDMLLLGAGSHYRPGNAGNSGSYFMADALP